MTSEPQTRNALVRWWHRQRYVEGGIVPLQSIARHVFFLAWFRATAPVRWLVGMQSLERALANQQKQITQQQGQLAQLYQAAEQHRDLLTKLTQQVPHVVAVVEGMDRRLKWYEARVPAIKRQFVEWTLTQRSALDEATEAELERRATRDAAIRATDAEQAKQWENGVRQPAPTAGPSLVH